jgi:hypothetical protein
VRSVAAIERELDIVPPPAARRAAAEWLLGLSEEVMEAWIVARGEEPTRESREGFRLLALHHQGARGMPSFHACRETCREVAYHYNRLVDDSTPAEPGQLVRMMTLLVRHLALFVGGKLEVERLGDFCCASRPVREQALNMAQEANVGDKNA